MKIRVIIPIKGTVFNKGIEEEVEAVRAPDCEVSYVNLATGPESISSRYQESLAVPDIIRLSQEAQKEGCDGIFIDCFGQPGVSVVRELVDIPVVGGFKSAVLAASLISQRFSIVSILKSVVPMIREMARDLGITENLASVREVGIPPLDLHKEGLLMKQLVEESTQALTVDGAESIVLGCTGMLHVTQGLEKRLNEVGLPTPVVNPTWAAVTSLQALIRSGLSQSRLTYYSPPVPSKKEVS